MEKIHITSSFNNRYYLPIDITASIKDNVERTIEYKIQSEGERESATYF
jgi:hypothetical protein